MPAVIPAVTTAVSAYGAYRASKNANKQLPGEAAANAGQAGAAKGLADTGSQLTGMGLPALQQAGGYFSKMANGNRATTAQALAPDIENIQGVYGGTARTLSRFLRGPERDTQLAETERERAGQIGSLFRNARPAANAQLASFGGAATDAGTGATGQAGSLFSGAAGRGMSDRYQGQDMQHQAGQDFGGLIFNLLKMYGSKGGASALASRSTVPSFSSFMPGGSPQGM